MAGSYKYTAVLDACVIYPAGLRDLLLCLGEEGAYRARWTEQIQQEWISSLLRNRPDLTRERLQVTIDSMNEAIEDGLIENYAYLIDSLALPDPKDRHVLAAAIVGHAEAIITYNLKDFPADVLAAHRVEVLHPDDFLIAQYDLTPIAFLNVVKSIRARLVKPPLTGEELIAHYEGLGLLQICKALKDAVGLI
jgi:predicted nucleic acid-binding protein